jgi:hypothetical protein
MSDETIDELLEKAERELQMAKKEICSPATNRVIDATEALLEVLRRIS